MRRPRKAQPAAFPAPTGGWISNRNLAIGRDPKLPPGAAVLDNFFPTSTGVVLRRGTQKRFSIGAGPVASMFRYVSGNQQQLFASIDGPIHEISGAEPTEARPGGSNGNWHTQQITTSGGTFLIGVNGEDDAWVYDGTSFDATTITFPTGAGLTTANLAYVWIYAQRLFFIEKDSMSAWYLPVDQIGGELTRLPLVGVFTRGGSLLWGQSWSLSSGGAGGLSDQCVFVSTEGEVVAYQGINPSSASEWTQVGLYRIGEPMGRNGFVRAGGDLLIATSVGFLSLAQAAQRDYAALGAAAVSYPIEEAWSGAVLERGMTDWRCVIWPEGKMVIVSPPRPRSVDAVALVANSNSGAWCRFTEWDARAFEVFNGQLHFGDSRGNIWLGNVSGSDNGAPYVGTCIPLFEDMGAPSARKIARNAKATLRALGPVRERVSAHFDFRLDLPPVPSAAPQEVTSIWDAGIWDVSTWGASRDPEVMGMWRSVGGSGYDMTLSVQVTSGDIAPIDVEIIRLDATYETAGMMS